MVFRVPVFFLKWFKGLRFSSLRAGFQSVRASGLSIQALVWMLEAMTLSLMTMGVDGSIDNVGGLSCVSLWLMLLGSRTNVVVLITSKP